MEIHKDRCQRKQTLSSSLLGRDIDRLRSFIPRCSFSGQVLSKDTHHKVLRVSLHGQRLPKGSHCHSRLTRDRISGQSISKDNNSNNLVRNCRINGWGIRDSSHHKEVHSGSLLQVQASNQGQYNKGVL